MAETHRGNVYRCPLCGAEVTVLAYKSGDFDPHCCNVEMVLTKSNVVFFYCTECAAEVTLLHGEEQRLDLHCCNKPMVVIPPRAA